MGKLFDKLRELVAADQYLVGEHASERLEERGVMEWQVLATFGEWQLMEERPRAKPNPAVEVRATLPDGTDFKVVWPILRVSNVAKLVTVHFFDEE